MGLACPRTFGPRRGATLTCGIPPPDLIEHEPRVRTRPTETELAGWPRRTRTWESACEPCILESVTTCVGSAKARRPRLFAFELLRGDAKPTPAAEVRPAHRATERASFFAETYVDRYIAWITKLI